MIIFANTLFDIFLGCCDLLIKARGFLSDNLIKFTGHFLCGDQAKAEARALTAPLVESASDETFAARIIQEKH